MGISLEKLVLFLSKWNSDQRYSPSRWKIWARAISEKVPIVQSNAIVESLWSVLKVKYLRKHSRPRLEFLVDIIMNQHISNLAKLVTQHRDMKNPEKPDW